MQVNVTDYLNERKYKTQNSGDTLSVIDQSGKSYEIDTSAFAKKEDGYYGNAADIRTALNKSNVGAPKGYVPLRNTLSEKGVNVGYSPKSDAPIVDGQLLNPSDSRLVKVGDTYYMDADFAKSFMPKTYKDPYEDKAEDLLDSLIRARFRYDPTEDEALKMAQKSAMLAAKQSANSRGLLGGTTAETMRLRAAEELVPTYEKMAYDRFLNEQANKVKALSILDALSDNAFREYETENDTRLATQKQAYLIEEAEREAFEADRKAAADTATNAFAEALKKVQLTGEVDEESAAVLHLPKGTLTEERRQFLEGFQQAMEKLMKTHQYNLERDAAALEGDLAKIYAKG